MFSKNMMLFVATAVALGAASAKGQAGTSAMDLSLKMTASRDIAELETFSEENVRLDVAAVHPAAIGGCVAIRDLPSGRVVEARDMICAGPALSLRDRGALDPASL